MFSICRKLYVLDGKDILFADFSGVTLTMFTIRRPPAEIFGAPTKYKMFTPKKKKKKVAIIFSVFTPKYFFLRHRTLIWPTYGTFLQPNNFNSKFWRRRGNRGYVTPLADLITFHDNGLCLKCYVSLSS